MLHYMVKNWWCKQPIRGDPQDFLFKSRKFAGQKDKINSSSCSLNHSRTQPVVLPCWCMTSFWGETICRSRINPKEQICTYGDPMCLPNWWVYSENTMKSFSRHNIPSSGLSLPAIVEEYLLSDVSPLYTNIHQSHGV